MRIDRIKLVTEMARAELGVNALAARAGMSRATVTAIKTGKSCQEETAAKIAAALGVPLDALVEKRGAEIG